MQSDASCVHSQSSVVHKGDIGMVSTDKATSHMETEVILHGTSAHSRGAG